MMMLLLLLPLQLLLLFAADVGAPDSAPAAAATPCADAVGVAAADTAPCCWALLSLLPHLLIQLISIVQGMFFLLPTLMQKLCEYRSPTVADEADDCTAVAAFDSIVEGHAASDHV